MKQRIRVLHAIYGFDVEAGGGGISRFAIELSKRLDPDLFNVVLCSIRYGNTPIEIDRINQLRSENIKTVFPPDWFENQPYRSFIKSTKWLMQEFPKTSIDIFHSHSEFTDISGALLKIMGRATKLIRTIHYGFHHEWRGKPVRRALLTNFAYPLVFDREIGVSQAITQRLNKRWMAQSKNRKSLWIPNALDPELFTIFTVNQGEKRSSLGIPLESPLFGSVGRLTEQKGYRYFIEAAAIVLKELPEAYFILIGDGELHKTLKTQVEQLAISSNFIFTGPRADIYELLPCLDVFVSSSLWEGLPTVIMESMSCKVPVIATDIPGTRELIIPDDNGWLVPSGDALTLADAMLKLFKEPQVRERLANHALDSVRAFSIETVAQRYTSLYLDLISTK